MPISPGSLGGSGKTIAVIGAGPSGLAAIKCCKEEGLNVVCFEKTKSLGGLWKYHDQDLDNIPSVMKSTVINTSKELSAFSDFPPPKEFPVFLHHSMMLKYFELYADKFGLREHVHYHSDVLKVEKTNDYEATGRWSLTVRNTEDNVETMQIFDGVMVCSGHHGRPYVPNFQGQDKFRGRILHSHSLKTNSPFMNSTVVVVGIGNSGLDAASEISNTAKQVYLSTRRGAWIFGKVYDRAIPSDAVIFTRMYDILRKIAGWRLSNFYIEGLANKRYDHSFLGIKPEHRILAQHPCVNEHVPVKILSGSVIVKKNIKTFTETGVIFDGEDTETEVDAVVFATGYQISFPFLSKHVIDTTHNQVHLYKYCFPPELTQPSLAFIGLVQPFGSIFPVSESQSRWYSLLMNGKVHLPSKQDMQVHMQKTKEKHAKRYVKSFRHTIQIDLADFMDQIAKEYGAKPNLIKYFFTDSKLFWACLLNPCVAYQFRLTGPHSWKGAREAVLGYNYRMSYPMASKHGKKFRYYTWYPYVPLITDLCLYLLGLLLILFLCHVLLHSIIWVID